MKPIVRVENLSKEYKIGGSDGDIPYPTFRESLVDVARAPFKLLRQNRNVKKNTFWALRNVSFEIMPGEVTGIIGRNGAGKSTLLKILSRITKPTNGRVELYGRIGSLLEVGTGFHPELTGRENIFLNGAILGMRREEIIKKFDEIVDFAEIEKFLDTTVKYYSSGMYMRLAFAVAAHLEPEILIVDEVLAVGDAEFQKKCLGKMRNISEREGRTVIFVSHNMSAISQLCSTAILLKHGAIDYSGNVQQAIKKYLQEGESSNKSFDGEQVKYAEVRQIGEQIEIFVDYECNEEIQIPGLGFVIYDFLGNPIIGRNFMADMENTVSFQPLNKKSGRVSVTVNSPKLCDGKYRVSLWFGNGQEDFFHAQDCLTFEVINMTSRKQLSTAIHGSVNPKCEWHFE
jgi:lipopolysaccharide transport system ATP-binding protein